MRKSRLVMFLVALALVASACSSGSDTAAAVATASDSAEAADAPDTSESDAPGETEEPAPSAVESGGTPMSASSPIGEFFSEGGGFESAVAEYQVRVEEVIVVCMAEQGFEFAQSGLRVDEVQQLQNELTIREWTSQFGYGISTSFDSVAQNQASDPNAEIVFGLGEAERELWIETLTGGGFGAVGGDLSSTPLEEQGCIGEALIETGGQEAIEGIETFSDAYEEGEEAIFDRAEMIEAVAAWSRCLSESGFPGYAERDDPSEEIADEFDAVIGPMSAALDELSDEEGQALIAGESLDLEDLPNLDLPALRDLQAREVELALADLDCYEAEVQETYEPLRDAFESGLLVEYATEFEALKNIGS